jgi:quercetin dioxygenase-like cupin family protein
MPKLKQFAWKNVELEKLNPLLDRQLVVGESVMIARIVLRKGCHVPLHSHENEQLSHIVEGALKFGIDGREIVVRAGEVLCIPPHMPHDAIAIEDTLAFDTFYPPRADWLAKTDTYLRGVAVTSDKGHVTSKAPQKSGAAGKSKPPTHSGKSKK